MWKRKKKKILEDAEQESLTSGEEEDIEEEDITEEVKVVPPYQEETTSSGTEQDKVDEVAAETISQEERIQPKEMEAIKEVSAAEEEDAPSGVFIFGNKIEGGFKKFITALFSIFLLPPTILFALLILTSVLLLLFLLVAIVLPMIFILFCILVVSLPVLIPFLTIVSLITDKGKVCFGFRNKKFAIKVLGITFPIHADR